MTKQDEVGPRWYEGTVNWRRDEVWQESTSGYRWE